ncbi:MAG: RluA family pseudouridine synthase [Bacillota bacterium]|nr:RluA family pseudouridine synthase [Bacillota bacterium]
MKRLDVYLTSYGHTRSYASKLIASGRVRVNGEPITKPSFCVSDADEVEYTDFEPVHTRLMPEMHSLSVCYEDDELLVIDKPRGMVVHPSKGHDSGTLVNALLALCPLSSIGGEFRPGIVHRLDKDTSGLILVAKNDVTHAALSAMIEAREVRRVYKALVHGVIDREGVVEAAMARDPKNRLKMTVVRGREGRNAVTRYTPSEHYRKHTLLDVSLITGRTHQIRVHMAYIGHPVVGDMVYGRKTDAGRFGEGQILHSQYLSFRHPRTGEMMEVGGELPRYFLDAIEKCQNI